MKKVSESEKQRAIDDMRDIMRRMIGHEIKQRGKCQTKHEELNQTTGEKVCPCQDSSLQGIFREILNEDLMDIIPHIKTCKVG